MKTENLLCAAVLLILTSVSWAATDDTKPPQLVSISIAPTNIDTSARSQEVLLTVRLRDELSGITAPSPANPSQAGAWAALGSPVVGVAPVVLSVPFYASMRMSGDELDGVYTNSLVLPRYSHAGNWTLFEFGAADTVGNQSRMSLAELRSLGFSTQFTVRGVDDREPPAIVSVAISPTTVDTSLSNQAVTITVHLRDDVAGMDRPMSQSSHTRSSISFASPSKGQHAVTSFAVEQRASGDQHDGVYTNVVWLPQYSEPGVWSLDSMVLVDAVGNQQRIDLAGALDRGLMSEFTVEGAGDTTPPQVSSFDFFPRRVETSSTNQMISFAVRLVDALSGMSNSVTWGYASAYFSSPSNGQSARVGFNAWTLAAGTAFDGVFTNTMIVPRYSETGVWSLQHFSVTDAAGNSTQLQLSDLRALGSPTQFAVGIAPSLTIRRQADSILLLWPAWASTFILQSQKNLDQSGAWLHVGIQPVVFGEDAVVAVPGSAGRAFYRLSEQP